MQLNFKSSLKSFHKTADILTKRQKECLLFLMKGMTIKEIGNTLQLSPRTVEHYIEAVKVKLDCNSRADLILKSIQVLPGVQQS